MSNSPLVNYTKISPNKTMPRNHVIDTITIHCVAGNCTVETIGNVFAPTSRQASSNYGVSTDGRIGMYVEEKDRSWCTSSTANDHRAITIEVANDGGESTGWHVSDTALQATITLIADICKRNCIKKLLWKGDKNLIGKIDQQNMTVHRWFAAKSCPGDYLYRKHGYIADEVNKLLGTTPIAEGTPILGKAEITADALAQFLLKRNPEPKLNAITALQLAQTYLDEGHVEGVRGDIAFCQSCLETAWWKFDNDVKFEQNNFAGIGATGGGNPGNSFATPQEGVRAQIQHLKAYASEEPLKQPCVDPRYGFVQKGCAKTWEELSGRWATDTGYAAKFLAFYNELKSFKPTSTETPTTSAALPVTETEFKPYFVRITTSALNIREEPSSASDSKVVKCLMNDKNIYTIVAESDGFGAKKWGKLKSGSGWISLDYTQKA